MHASFLPSWTDFTAAAAGGPPFFGKTMKLLWLGGMKIALRGLQSMTSVKISDFLIPSPPPLFLSADVIDGSPLILIYFSAFSAAANAKRDCDD